MADKLDIRSCLNM